MGGAPGHPAHRYRVRRGISFLEVVFATVVLAMTIATMATTVNAISAQQGRSRQLLTCAEIASRLVIQYLDDPKAMPSEDLPLDYGDEEYRWRMNITRVESVLDPTVARSLESYETRQTGTSPDRIKKVVITVWLSEQSGGTRLANQGAPQSTIVRVVDPLAFSRRSPDTMRNLLQNGPDAVLEAITGSDIEAEEEE